MRIDRVEATPKALALSMLLISLMIEAESFITLNANPDSAFGAKPKLLLS